MPHDKYDRQARLFVEEIQAQVAQLPHCPDCAYELEFEYGEGFWLCTRCGFEYHEEDD